MVTSHEMVMVKGHGFLSPTKSKFRNYPKKRRIITTRRGRKKRGTKMKERFLLVN
jgi:hypothetical protein